MSCCGQSQGNTLYTATDEAGTVHTFLTEPEARIWLAENGGGVIRTEHKPG